MKLEKSIYRTVEYKYRNIILGLNSQVKEYEEFKKNAYANIKRLEDEIDTLSNENNSLTNKVETLEERERLRENPSVAVKDLEEEVYRVKTGDKRNTVEVNEKRKANFAKEINTISALRDEPPGEILKTQPLPRQIILPTPIIPPPGSPRKGGKKRDRSSSTSPIASPRSMRVRKEPQENFAYSNSDDSSLTPSLLVPLVNKKKRKRKRKEKEM